jgi:predicted alpha/beta hydrolase family esterase
MRFLVVPGWQSSGPDHWQTHLEASLDGASRVAMTDWITPKTADWIDSLERAVDDCAHPPIVIAHSLGCIATAHVIARGRVAIAGALLVAPADLDRPHRPPALAGFAPPRERHARARRSWSLPTTIHTRRSPRRVRSPMRGPRG